MPLPSECRKTLQLDDLAQFRLTTFDDELGRRIIETHIWAVREGLRGAAAYDLFDGYCQRLVIHGAPLWRAHAAMETLHPQWNGYGYTWRRDLNAIEPEQYAHGERSRTRLAHEPPLTHLIRRARDGEANPSMRRRLEAGRTSAISRSWKSSSPWARRTTSLISTSIGRERRPFAGERGSSIPSPTDRKGGFSDDDVTLIDATLPALSLAMKAHAGHVIASGLLGTYLGEDAGRRVHAGAVHARVGREAAAPCSGTPTSAASPRSATPRPGPSSSTCSTTSSRL